MEKLMDKCKEEEWMEERIPDKIFMEVNKAVIEVAEKFFAKGKAKENENVAAIRKRRMDLLKARRDMREELGRCEEGEFEETCELLKEATKKCRRKRREEMEKTNEKLLEELWIAWRRRRLAEVHRLAGMICGSKYGPKNRHFRHCQ